MANGGVTYTEIRSWAVFLQHFTAHDLADALHASHEVGVRGIKALLWHGIIEPTGDELPGYNGDGPQPIYRHKPLPRGPREHHTLVPPERMVGYTEILCPRGMPVGGTSSAGTRDMLRRRQSIVGRSKRKPQGTKGGVAS